MPRQKVNWDVLRKLSEAGLSEQDIRALDAFNKSNVPQGEPNKRLEGIRKGGGIQAAAARRAVARGKTDFGAGKFPIQSANINLSSSFKGRSRAETKKAAKGGGLQALGAKKSLSTPRQRSPITAFNERARKNIPSLKKQMGKDISSVLSGRSKAELQKAAKGKGTQALAAKRRLARMKRT